MAPRKAKAAGEDDRCPTLKLIMEKGPLSGQTKDFLPGSVIRIGRTIRGNTLALKDAGVSTKHLLIQVEATPDSGLRRWTITDLGSSNGTILNGEVLEPSAVLSNGDVIKIGEQTSIRVEFEGGVVENEISSANTRGNTRRRVRNHATGLGVIDEFSELCSENKEDEKKIDDASEVEEKQERNVNTRRTRSSQKKESESKDLNTDENRDLGLNGVTELPGVSTRRTKSSRNEGGATETGIHMSVIEGKRTRRGRPRKNIPVEIFPEETEKEEENVVMEIISDSKGGAVGLGSTSGVKESNINTGKGSMVADLETMTMGEWFDFLEVYLPQQIIVETEAKIAEMRQMAERFHKFMVQQKASKG